MKVKYNLLFRHIWGGYFLCSGLTVNSSFSRMLANLEQETTEKVT